ncbi:MAG: hypothetical protein IPJ82_19950 [Lewinellaceae bacterium]|nr:hypothetical protein [Lewinellaceae bacterium]
MTAKGQAGGGKQIVFVSQKEKLVRMLEREGERWIDTEFYEEDDLPHIEDCAVPLEEVYRKVKFGGNSRRNRPKT